jgi:hypothetical protein
METQAEILELVFKNIRVLVSGGMSIGDAVNAHYDYGTPEYNKVMAYLVSAFSPNSSAGAVVDRALELFTTENPR